MEAPTLLEVIEKSERVYLDNSILNLDVNRDDIQRSTGADRNRGIQSIVLRLGAASNFREVKYWPVQRQALYAQKLSALIENNLGLQSTPMIIAEYESFITALETSLEFLNAHSSSKKKGKKQRALEEAIKYHKSTYELFVERSEFSEKVALVARTLGDARMHISKDGKYVKRMGRTKTEASKGDTELAAGALVYAAEHSGDVAIITADSDVVNLIRNFGLLSNQDFLPLELRSLSLQSKVKVYFPSSAYWVPHFGLLEAAYVPAYGKQSVTSELTIPVQSTAGR